MGPGVIMQLVYKYYFQIFPHADRRVMTETGVFMSFT